MSETKFMIYGAYGYTGELIAREAAARGLNFVLAGRRPEPLDRLATELEVESQPFQLESEAIVEQNLRGVPILLNCAGPFTRTFRPLVEACLRTGTHYLDITGEVDVFESIARRHSAAEEAGIVMMPGVGFDVVPTDCLARSLFELLPGADRLLLAIAGLTRVSRGTATTMIEGVGRGSTVRRAGRLERVPAAWRSIEVDFGDGKTTCVSIPWGDLATAFRTTGIPNIETFAALPSGRRLALISTRYLGGFLSSRPVQAFLKSRAGKGSPGPSEKQRAEGRSFVYGLVEEGSRSVEGRLSTPDGYTFTVFAALACIDRLAAAPQSPGYHTPAGLFGADFVLELPGVERTLGAPTDSGV